LRFAGDELDPDEISHVVRQEPTWACRKGQRYQRGPRSPDITLAFLAIGMLAGDEHVLGIPFDDFGAAYLIGSVALAVVLFEGGRKTPVSILRLAFWPAAVLTTIGVGVTPASWVPRFR